MPPEKVRTSELGDVGQAEPLQQLVGAAPRLATRQVVEAADHLEVRAGGQQPVDGRSLTGEPDSARAPRAGIGDDVEAGDATRGQWWGC